MSNILKTLAAGSASEPTDEYFNQTTLLLHGDGTNGAQNNTFLDSSTNNFTITRNGNTTQGTFSPFSLAEGQWSNYFDGSGDYLTAPDDAAFAFGTGDYTIEFWYYANSSSGQGLMCTGTSSQSTNWQIIIDASTAEIVFQYSSSSAITGPVVTTNAWTHIAATRSGTDVTLWINGVSVGTATSSDNLSTQSFFIGRNRANTLQANGYISNARLLKGTALYTGAFTPPTAPLTAIANTQLLTCQSNRFVDNSSNAFAITTNGNTSVQPFSPFAPSAAYSPSVNGGSGYFDGSGDYLSVPDDAAWAFGSGDFTVEAWIYTTAGAGTSRAIVGQWQNSAASTSAWQLYITTGNDVRFLYGVGGTQITTVQTTSTVSLNTWTHIAVSKSSNDYAIWFNGVREATRTATETINDSAYDLRVGSNNSNDYFDGFISGVRVVKGTPVYDPANTTITIPTAPFEQSDEANTELLCNFTNAGIFDNTGKNNLETVGNAQIDTAIQKYGTGALEFDGTGDWILAANSPNLNFGAGDFTIEYWFYPTQNRGVSGHFAKRASGGSYGILNYIDGTNLIPSFFFASGPSTFAISGASPTSAFTLNQWTHYAVTRQGSTFRIFMNGVAEYTSGPVTAAQYDDGSPFVIGAYGANGDGPIAAGLIDDFRITKGVARYTSNFTVPDKAFPDL